MLLNISYKTHKFLYQRLSYNDSKSTFRIHFASGGSSYVYGSSYAFVIYKAELY